MVTIQKWFRDRVGIVTGIVTSMSGFAGLLFAFLMPLIMEYGWRMGYLFAGVAMLAMLTVAGLLIRTDPKSCGMEPYANSIPAAENIPGQENGETALSSGLSFKDTISSAELWVFFGGSICFGFMIAFSQSAVPYFMGIGFSLAQASAFIGVMSAGMIVWKFALGWASDKIGTELTYFIMLLLSIVAFAFQLVSGASNAAVPYIFIFLYAGGMSSISVLNPIVARDLFGMKDYLSIFPIVNIGMSVSSSVCVALWGVIYSISGSYVSALYLAAAGAAVMLVCLLVSYELSKRKYALRRSERLL
jgi:Na+/melibiose symporter-like transporter